MTNRQLVAAVFAVGIAVRVAALGLIPSGLEKDTDAYGRLAVVWRTTGTYGLPATAAEGQLVASTPVRPTAYRPPLYPLLLSGLVAEGKVVTEAVAMLHLAIGIATIVGVWWLGRAWGLGKTSAVAALLVACDPILVFQSTQLMTETLAAFLPIAVLVALTRSVLSPAVGGHARWLWLLAAGLTAGAACLTRPTFLPWCGWLAISLVVWPAIGTSRVKSACVLGLAWLLVVLPWGLRNAWHFGDFRLSTTHGGYTLLLGNNPDFYEHLRSASWGEVWKSEKLDRQWSERLRQLETTRATGRASPSAQVPAEIEQDRLAYTLARQHMRAEPAMAAWSSLVRVARLWNPLPHSRHEREGARERLVRWSIAVWYLALGGMVAWSVPRLGRSLVTPPWLWGVLLCAVFTAVHALYWSDLRMRAPLMPVVALIAARSLGGAAKRN